jgi:N-acetylmuramoyl-L-alanine amidase
MELTPHARPRWRCVCTTLSALLFALLALASCGGPKRPPSNEVPGYERLRDVLGDFDFAPLHGRRIVIDPGHGGFFRGAIGLNGLSEAEVNLGVALYLRGLLEWAGAQVFLTRTADYDFLSPADSSLAADLAARVAIVDSLQPDVFISIHHNSNAELDRDLNETQTYYPVGREGAALDLARAIHKYLVRNLNISPAKIMAGNFHVLRNSPVPAVLGEPSMLSNPAIEKRLSLAAKQELEAQAYFLGLLEYFAKGTPRFVSAHGETLGTCAAPVWIFDPGAPGDPALDPTSVRLFVDGCLQPAAVEADGRTVRLEAPLPAGSYSLALSARNLAGRSTPTWNGTLLEDLGALAVSLYYENAPRSEGPRVLIQYRCSGPSLERYRNLRILSRGPQGKEWTLRLPGFAGPYGWVLARADSLPAPRAAEAELQFGLENCYGSWSGIRQALKPLSVQFISPPARLMVLDWPAGQGPSAAGCPRHVRQRWSPAGWPVRFFPLPPGSSSALEADPPRSPFLQAVDGYGFWLEADGAQVLFLDGDHRLPWSEPESTPPDTLPWQPLLPELLGRRIVLDPTGGGNETDGAGPLGTRGADLNLRVAEMTAALLRGAGAEVTLTREDERWVPPEAKVKLANDLDADLFMIIGRSQDPARRLTARYHHGSRTGRNWAELVVQVAAPLLTAPAESALVEPSYAYLLRQTACPALLIGLESPATMTAEERLGEPSYEQAQARALFLGTAAIMVGEDLFSQVVDPARLLAAIADRAPAPGRIDWVQWDGNLLWLPPRWSGAAEDSLSLSKRPGLPAVGLEHTLEIHAGPNWQLWALRRTAEAEWEWKLLLENR